MEMSQIDINANNQMSLSMTLAEGKTRTRGVNKIVIKSEGEGCLA